MAKRVIGGRSRTAEQRKREKEIHERFKREKPSLEDLVASGEYSEPISQADFWQLRDADLPAKG